MWTRWRIRPRLTQSLFGGLEWARGAWIWNRTDKVDSLIGGKREYEKPSALHCDNSGLQRHLWALSGAKPGGYRWENASGYSYTLKMSLHTLPNVLKEQNERENCLQEFMCIWKYCHMPTAPPSIVTPRHPSTMPGLDMKYYPYVLKACSPAGPSREATGSWITQNIFNRGIDSWLHSLLAVSTCELVGVRTSSLPKGVPLEGLSCLWLLLPSLPLHLPAHQLSHPIAPHIPAPPQSKYNKNL